MNRTLDSWTVDAETLAELTERLPDPVARGLLVKELEPVVRSLARRFAGRGEQLDDLVQVAALGLVKAIDRFDPRRGKDLLPYATVVITGELRHHLRDRVGAVRMPRAVQNRKRQILQCMDELNQRLGRAPTPAEIAAATELSIDEVIEAYDAVTLAAPVSLDALREAGDEPPVPHADDEVDFIEEWASVAPGILDLPHRQRRILYLKFYRSCSQTQIAEQLGISQVHVSRLLGVALSHLRATAAP